MDREEFLKKFANFEKLLKQSFAEHKKTLKQRDELLEIVNSALVTLKVMEMKITGGGVATNKELLKIMGDSFREAIKNTK